MQSRSERASAFSADGFNCATAVFAAFCEDYDIPVEMASRLTCGMAGGFGQGEICGVVSSAILIIGLKYGQSAQEDNDARTVCSEKAGQFVKGFRKKHIAITCRDLLDADISTTMGRLMYRERRSRCTGFIESSVELLENLGC